MTVNPTHRFFETIRLLNEWGAWYRDQQGVYIAGGEPKTLSTIDYVYDGGEAQQVDQSIAQLRREYDDQGKTHKDRARIARVIILRHAFEKSNPQIATDLGRSEATVKMWGNYGYVWLDKDFKAKGLLLDRLAGFS